MLLLLFLQKHWRLLFFVASFTSGHHKFPVIQGSSHWWQQQQKMNQFVRNYYPPIALIKFISYFHFWKFLEERMCISLRKLLKQSINKISCLMVQKPKCLKSNGHDWAIPVFSYRFCLLMSSKYEWPSLNLLSK
jgi:hypothetical protein